MFGSQKGKTGSYNFPLAIPHGRLVLPPRTLLHGSPCSVSQSSPPQPFSSSLLASKTCGARGHRHRLPLLAFPVAVRKRLQSLPLDPRLPQLSFFGPRAGLSCCSSSCKSATHGRRPSSFIGAVAATGEGTLRSGACSTPVCSMTSGGSGSACRCSAANPTWRVQAPSRCR
jgi:hypothetical protein